MFLFWIIKTVKVLQIKRTMMGMMAAGMMAAGAATVTPKATTEALINPEMGWMYYHYSNRLWAYGCNTKSGDTLDWFPGCSTIYYRLMWSDLEPEEGGYRWDIIDSTAQNWIKKGKKLCFRVVACDQKVDAVPKYVRDAGAKGYWFEYKTDTVPSGKLPPRWEPVYDDPIFIAKLEKFLKAFARRYDGDPSVAFVDVGTFGIFGECHLSNTSQHKIQAFPDKYPGEFERLAKLHLNLWKKFMPNTYLVVSDDLGGGWTKGDDHPMMEYCREIGIGFRDDSIFCFPPKGTSKCPFEYWAHDGWARKFADKYPVVVETGHMNYIEPIEGKWSAEAYERCVEAYQASYLSIHDFPEAHYKTHKGTIAKINQKLGYRFELGEVKYPDVVKRGEKVSIESKWVNVGVAPKTKSVYMTYSLINRDGTVAWSWTDEGFDFMVLKPKLGGVEKAQAVSSACQFGFDKVIPQPDNCVVWSLNAGRVFDDVVVMLKPGEYELCVSVGDVQGTPTIALPIEGQLGNSRRYRLGKMRVE
ncbi:MAG: DUF4832 domain-containing protein [Kiritimatiellia bacterium]|jgi:hypothetical protein|nr:DUF4832 domain-containing protein [Kiritimatiellia bacterium]